MRLEADLGLIEVYELFGVSLLSSLGRLRGVMISV